MKTNYKEIVKEQMAVFDSKIDHKNQAKGFCDGDCDKEYSVQDIREMLISSMQSAYEAGLKEGFDSGSKALVSEYKAGGEATLEVVGKIGAKLLARHSPQIVLDSYFDVANEELEAIKNQDENNN